MHFTLEWLVVLRAYWADFSWGIALFVCVAYVVLDVLYAQYTMSVNALKPLRAATTGSFMYFLLAVGVLNYAHNPLYIPGLVLGSWIGTYVAVEHQRRKKENEASVHPSP